MKMASVVGTRPNLSELVKKGESEEVEFKKSTAQLDRALKSVCGFLNHKGGKVYFGINKGIIVGQAVSDQTLKSISQKIRQRIKPEISLEIKVLEIEDKKIIEVKIKEGDNKPYYLDGIAYKRVGTENVVVPPEELERIILNKHEQEFDSKICKGASYEDIDLKAVKWFKRKYKEFSGKELQGSNIDILKSLDCVSIIDDKLKLTNAGILLFGKYPKKIFPRYYISIARYPGKDIGISYLEIMDIEGNLFELIDKADNYIRQHIETLYLLKEGQIAREPVSQYPDFVIRELIVNAVAHRDYSIKGSKILIKMFKDRIEFDSPGSFPGNVNEKNILEEQFSRNPVIVKALNRVKYIEEMGEGWNRIFREVQNYPLKFGRLPEIKGNSRVVATVSSPELEEKSFKEKAMKGLWHDYGTIMARFNKSQISSIEYVIKNKKITRLEYEKNYGISKRTAVRELKKIVNSGIFKVVGKGPGTYYTLAR